MLKEELNKLDQQSELYMEEFKRVAKEHLREYVESVTDAAPSFGPNFYICPCCKSGTGKNNHFTPAFHLFRTKDGELHFKCHSCGITGDIFALAGLVNHATSFTAQQEIVASFLGIDLSRRTPLTSIQISDAKVSPSPNKKAVFHLKKEARDYILRCRTHIDETDFFHRRGLSAESIQHFNLGYDPEKHLAIIPFSMSYYMARNVNVGMDQKGPRKHLKPTGLRQPLFNMAAFSTSPNEPIFIVEAPLDAISIVQSGGAAIALGGKSTGVLEKILDIYRPERHFVLAFDQDAAGKATEEKVTTLFRNRELSCSTPAHPIFSQYKDANAILLADPEGLRKAVAKEKELLRERQAIAPVADIPIEKAKEARRAAARPEKTRHRANHLSRAITMESR